MKMIYQTLLCVLVLTLSTAVFSLEPPRPDQTIVYKYYDTGELRLLHYYTKDPYLLDGPSVYYYKSGAVYREEAYVQGKLFGSRREFYESGDISMEEYYWNGKLNGLRREYYEHGHVLREELWEEGRLLEIKLFTFEGDVIYEESFEGQGSPAQ